MPVYASFLKLTPEGNKDVKQSRERFEMGRKNVEKFGGRILSAFYIISRNEYLILTEFPDEEARAKSMINTIQRGNVSYEVYQAIPVNNFFELVDSA